MSTEFFSELEVECKLQSDLKATGQNLIVFLDKGTLLDAVNELDAAGMHLEDVMAIDVEEGFQCIYHFADFVGNDRVTLKVTVPHDDPKVPSISGIYAGADWHERECYDFHGVEFTGHPYLKPLLLADDMTDLNPLRKAEDARKPYTTFMPEFTIVDCPDDHPMKKLADDREVAAKEAAEKEAAAKAKAEEEAAAKAAEAKEEG